MPKKTLRDFASNLRNAWGLLIIHGFALFALIVFPPDLWALLLAAVLYVIGMFGTTAGYHRYFSHKTFKTSRVGAFALGWLAQSSLQRGVLWWAAHHRHHHRYSDQPEDLHSPKQHGTLHAHVGWVISDEANEPDYGRIRDLAKYPELVWLDKWFWVPGIAWLAMAGLIGGAFGGWYGAGWGMAWGFVIPLTALYHGVFTINSLSHTWGRRVYVTEDTSRNNALLAIITLGEGWHNNHHRYPSSCRQGFLWWQYDVTFWVLSALSRVGLVWDMKAPPQRILDERSPVSLPAVLSGRELAWARAHATLRIAEASAQRAAATSAQARGQLGRLLDSARATVEDARASAILAAEEGRMRAIAAAEDARIRAVTAAEDARHRAEAAAADAWKAAEDARHRAEAAAADAWKAAEDARLHAIKVARDAHEAAVQTHDRALQAVAEARNTLQALEPALS